MSASICIVIEYGHDVHTVMRKAINNPDTLLRMELGADDKFTPCVHNKNGKCQDVIDITFRPLALSSKREYYS